MFSQIGGNEIRPCLSVSHSAAPAKKEANKGGFLAGQRQGAQFLFEIFPFFIGIYKQTIIQAFGNYEFSPSSSRNLAGMITLPFGIYCVLIFPYEQDLLPPSPWKYATRINYTPLCSTWHHFHLLFYIFSDIPSSKREKLKKRRVKVKVFFTLLLNLYSELAYIIFFSLKSR